MYLPSANLGTCHKIRSESVSITSCLIQFSAAATVTKAFISYEVIVSITCALLVITEQRAILQDLASLPLLGYGGLTDDMHNVVIQSIRSIVL